MRALGLECVENRELLAGNILGELLDSNPTAAQKQWQTSNFSFKTGGLPSSAETNQRTAVSGFKALSGMDSSATPVTNLSALQVDEALGSGA